jgi:hypothetical protein
VPGILRHRESPQRVLIHALSNKPRNADRSLLQILTEASSFWPSQQHPLRSVVSGELGNTEECCSEHGGTPSPAEAGKALLGGNSGKGAAGVGIGWIQGLDSDSNHVQRAEEQAGGCSGAGTCHYPPPKVIATIITDGWL